MSQPDDAVELGIVIRVGHGDTQGLQVGQVPQIVLRHSHDGFILGLAERVVNLNQRVHEVRCGGLVHGTHDDSVCKFAGSIYWFLVVCSVCC